MDGWGGAALSVCKLISLSWYQKTDSRMAMHDSQPWSWMIYVWCVKPHKSSGDKPSWMWYSRVADRGKGLLCLAANGQWPLSEICANDYLT